MGAEVTHTNEAQWSAAQERMVRIVHRASWAAIALVLVAAALHPPSRAHWPYLLALGVVLAIIERLTIRVSRLEWDRAVLLGLLAYVCGIGVLVYLSGDVTSPFLVFYVLVVSFGALWGGIAMGMVVAAAVVVVQVVVAFLSVPIRGWQDALFAVVVVAGSSLVAAWLLGGVVREQRKGVRIMSALGDLASEIARTTDGEAAMRAVCQRAIALTAADIACAAVMHDGEVEHMGVVGLPGATPDSRVCQQLLAAAAERGEEVCTDDWQAESQFSEVEPLDCPARAVHVFPLQVGASDRAFLLAGKLGPGLFEPTDVQLLRSLTQYAAAGLGRALLLAETLVANKRLSTVNDVIAATMQGTGLRDVLHRSVPVLMQAVRARVAVVYLVTESKRDLELAYQAGLPEEEETTVAWQVVRAEHTGVAGRTAFWQQQITVENLADEPAAFLGGERARRLGLRKMISIPLVAGADLLGALQVAADSMQPLDEDLVEILPLLAGSLGLVADRWAKQEAQQRLLWAQATTDALTSTMNRRGFEEALRKELDRSRRYGYPLSLAMLDVDRFKEFNDRFGHAEGDRVLKAVAEALADSLRSSDIVARYGGDEFVVVMPHAERQQADAVFARVDDRVAKRTDFGMPLSLSVGIVSYPSDQIPVAEEVLRQADERMYAAKRARFGQPAEDDSTQPSP